MQAPPANMKVGAGATAIWSCAGMQPDRNPLRAEGRPVASTALVAIRVAGQGRIFTLFLRRAA